jgi:hypothetical protein
VQLSAKCECVLIYYIYNFFNDADGISIYIASNNYILKLLNKSIRNFILLLNQEDKKNGSGRVKSSPNCFVGFR